MKGTKVIMNTDTNPWSCYRDLIGKGLCTQNIKQMITVFSIQFWPEGEGWGEKPKKQMKKKRKKVK